MRLLGIDGQEYQKEISCPFMNWINIHVELPRVAFEKLTDKRTDKLGEKVRERIGAAIFYDTMPPV
jgi:predicted ATPase with chaperone activity